jgi:GNAT superfamily N-acetyltransferase
MSIEIDILNGDASWPKAEPLHRAVWGPDAVGTQPWAHIKWANADLRVLIDAPDGSGLACHVGVYFRTVIWNGHRVHVGGIGGVATREDCRRRGYASLALDAAVHTMRANDAVKFAILFCEPHNFSFYEARGWHAFTGEVVCAQPSGPIKFDAMAPFVFDIVRAPRQGKIDLCGLPW